MTNLSATRSSFFFRKARQWLAIGALAIIAAAASAQTAPKVTQLDPPKKVLFVGNSFSYYNNSLHNHVLRLAKEADPVNADSYQFKSMTISGGFLYEEEPAMPAMLKSKKWDVVVLQGNSSEPLPSNREHAARFRASVLAIDKLVRESGAKSALYMTWAYQGKPEMTAPLAEAYTGVGNEAGALVVPAGLAFERALRERPGLVLHVSDKMHPTLAGSYLVACTFFSALYGKSAVGMAYPEGLDKDTASFLQGVAWATVNAFYGKKG